MKTIRSLMIMTGLLLAIFTLGPAGARGQVLDSAHFKGTFNLPVAARWGTMNLPAGEYTLRYGTLPAGPTLVEIAGKAKGSPRGVILVGPIDPTSAKKNSIVCIREGNSLLVRELELPAIGESVRFPMPRGITLVAQKRSHGKYTLAQASNLIQRVPVIVSGE